MWVQTYAPFFDSVVLSAVVALVPIVLVFVLMGVFKRPAHQATVAGLMVALVLAVTVWAMPTRLLVSAAMLGVAVALVPLLWTLVGAVWFINLLVHSGHFDVIRRSLTALTPDRRLQTLLIGFGFLGLLEGLVAIGSPVAIGAAMLVGFGFPPITASVVALVGFSHPGVWGPMGLPVVVLQSVTTGIDLDALGMMIGRQVPLLTLVCAPVMVALVAGWRGTTRGLADHDRDWSRLCDRHLYDVQLRDAVSCRKRRRARGHPHRYGLGERVEASVGVALPR